MDRERGARGDVAHARVLLHAACRVARPRLLRREHLALPSATIVVLRSGCDLERPHVLGDVDAGEVQRERSDLPFFVRFAGGREVAVPRLELGALEWDVEADLDE